ncbi:olfactory receptor 52N4-like [Ictidomys tridecemlineatus]|uniref:Olfactory receptor n=1 Tax=Ictidomys tridecemlineatus TaxID=43179 RepID=I3NG61_ICTTR|nr:olfactory receptor 52N4-like [Ictidomys tridecemlineatus]KAG3285883.1 olfactory receptor 52N4-like [Ictidomys tridecemlineatus]
MLILNQTDLTPASFILNGIPGLEDMHIWISFPFCSMYVVAVVGNCGLLYLIRYEDSLHRSMYYFLAMLSLTDLVICSSTIPKALCIFWFNLKEIGFDECLVQMFFIHIFTGMESGLLMLMALDRYVAICYPLHYSAILTNDVIGKVGLATFLRGVLLITPFTFLTKRLPYCKGNVIPHTYCDHMSVVKLSCGNVKVNAIYGLVVALLIGGLDILCITVSYTMILRAVVSLSSEDARQKAFSTCTAHICAIVFSYSPAFFFFFSHRFGGHTIPPSCHIIVANIYLLLPPTMNPVVYGVKTKQIRDCVMRILSGSKETKSYNIK